MRFLSVRVELGGHQTTTRFEADGPAVEAAVGRDVGPAERPVHRVLLIAGGVAGAELHTALQPVKVVLGQRLVLQPPVAQVHVPGDGRRLRANQRPQRGGSGPEVAQRLALKGLVVGPHQGEQPGCWDRHGPAGVDPLDQLVRRSGVTREEGLGAQVHVQREGLVVRGLVDQAPIRGDPEQTSGDGIIRNAGSLRRRRAVPSSARYMAGPQTDLILCARVDQRL